MAAGAVGSFHVAFLFQALSWLAVVYLGCLFALRRVATGRQAFYAGFAIGIGVFVPNLGFFWTLFQFAAVPLWVILAFFHGLFLLLLNRVEFRLGPKWAVVLAPVLWCGIEYFRSEVWWLRFSWFGVGSMLEGLPMALFGWLGVYGIGFALLTFVALTMAAWNSPKRAFRLKVLIAATLGISLWLFPSLVSPRSGWGSLRVAGLQLEFPGFPEVITSLDKLANTHPEAKLLMLSEYTFDGPPPGAVKAWCRQHGKWLVVGGKQPLETQVESGREKKDGDAVERLPTGSDAQPASGAMSVVRSSSLAPSSDKERFYNTAFVISTNGEIVFTQAKVQPIQFFNDGEPAPTQRIWDSPWGKLGIAICYDASYRRVTDELVRQGAVALLFPTMDVEAWGEYQHRLNSRMARIRAAEYRVPIFRVASSGISQVINNHGYETATAPFPGPGEMIAGELRWNRRYISVPFDTRFHLAPACTWATGGVMLWLAALAWRDRRTKSAVPSRSDSLSVPTQ